MTDQKDNNPPPGEDGGGDTEPDLRSILDGSARRRVIAPEPVYGDGPRIEGQRADEEIAPPYEPPVRPGDEPPTHPRPVSQPGVQRGERPAADRPQQPQGDQKLPPIWPGDENQPWFRKERGLPPLPGQDGTPTVGPDGFPTPLADIPQRGRAYGVTVLLPNIVGLIPTIGLIFSTIFLVVNLFLFRQGQDVGAVIFKLRVVRENGDVAGFFQMFVRNAASTISLLLLGAGFWGAFSDPNRRTWHDKWLGTYVVKDSPEYNTRRRSSSEQAFKWFWIILMLVVGASILIWLNGPVPTETTPTNGGAG